MKSVALKQAEKAGKRRLLSFTGWRSKNQSSKGEIPPNGRVLMVRHSERLGNLVILGLAIDILKKAMPKLSIDVLAPENYKYVLEINHSVDKVIGLNKKDFFRYPWTFITLLGQLKKGRYDLAIDCSDNISRSASARFYTIMAAAKTTAGYDKMAKPLYAIPVSPEILYDHAVDMYLRLFEQVFGGKLQLTDNPIPNPTIDLSLPVLLNVGGRGKKIWPIEEIIKVAMLLEKMKVDYKFLLGPNESELACSLINQFGENMIVKPNSTRELVEVINKASGFVSSDTGPMHVAWSCGLPTVAVFIDSQMEKFRPLGKRSIALDGRYMQVSPENVVEALLKIRGIVS